MIIRTCLLILCAALTGCMHIPHSVGSWSGAFPSNEFRLQVTTTSGSPITNATLSVSRPDGSPSFGYPIDEFTETHTPMADAAGLITVRHSRKYPEFGGGYDRYCGFIRWPLLRRAPKHSIIISAQHFTPKKLSYRSLVIYNYEDISSNRYTVSEATVKLKRRSEKPNKTPQVTRD